MAFIIMFFLLVFMIYAPIGFIQSLVLGDGVMAVFFLILLVCDFVIIFKAKSTDSSDNNNNQNFNKQNVSKYNIDKYIEYYGDDFLR